MVGAGLVAFGAVRLQPPTRTPEAPTHDTPWSGPD
jgi:hypothetical protein